MADPIHPQSLIGPESFKGVDVAWPHKAYRATIGAHPLIEVPALAGAGAAAGYLGAGLAQNVLGRIAGGLPGEMGAGAQEWFADPENQQTLRDRMAAIGAALGGTYGVAKNVDIGSGWGGAAKSLTESDYLERNPEARNRLLQRRLGELLSRRYQLKKFRWDRGRQLEASDIGERAAGDPFFQTETPIRQSLTYVGVDPFLSNSQKYQTQGLLVNANNGQTAGYTSGRSLMQSALKAGVGFGTAYLFGHVAGNVLALPPETVKNLSLAGGLAGALVNTGIFKELGMKKEAVLGEVAKGTYGAGKSAVAFSVDEIVAWVKKLAPILLLAPAATGVGAAYMASKLTSPSKKDEEALSSEMQTAELQRQIADISRIRALSRQQGNETNREKPRGIRI